MINYINKNNKKPSNHDKNIEIKFYGRWISGQLKNYKNNEQIMKNENIKKLWEEFVNDSKYKKYFLSNEDEWKLNLEWIINYIDKNNKRPSEVNEKTKYYSKWIGTQIGNYKNNKHIMENDNIKKLWENFINDPIYKKYF